MLGQLVGGFIVIMIGISLLPVITNEVEQANSVNNVSSPITQTAIKFVPIFFALAIAIAAIGMVVIGLKNLGLDESDDYKYDEPIETEQRPKKQTYKEYVKERLQIESMLSYNPLRRWFG